MGRPRKSLLERVREGTFRPDRYAGLLDDEPLPETPLPGWDGKEWRKLLRLQAAYRDGDDEERPAAAALFARFVGERARHTWTLAQWMHATCGPGHELAAQLAEANAIDYADAEAELWSKWERWDRRHGLLFRARAGYLTNVDKVELHWRMTLAGETNLDAIANELPELLPAYLEENESRRPPDPPGWELLTRIR